jgi:hypothetical protein
MIKRALLLLSSSKSEFNKNTALKLIYVSKRAISKYGQSSFNRSLILYNLLSELENKSSTKDLYTTYESFQKLEANKLSINDELEDNIIPLVLC